MTPKQQHILGDGYSQRIATLLARLEELSGQETVFDRDLAADPIFGTPDGQYHACEAVPRISLAAGASELTVAHELVHGILTHEHYPQYRSTWRIRFPFLSDVVREVSHCPIHIVINRRLHALGYDVLTPRVAGAEGRLAELDKLKVGVNGLKLEHWWCIRIACEAAHHSSYPAIPEILAASFEESARHYFPACGGLIDKFKAIVASMDIDDPRNVQACLRRMIATIEQEYGSYFHFMNLRKLSLIGPAFVTARQLGEPASSRVRLEIGILVNQEKQRNGTIVVAADRFSGDTWAVATSDDVNDQNIRLDLDERLKRPLREFLDWCGAQYVEEGANGKFVAKALG